MVRAQAANLESAVLSESRFFSEAESARLELRFRACPQLEESPGPLAGRRCAESPRVFRREIVIRQHVEVNALTHRFQLHADFAPVRHG